MEIYLTKFCRLCLRDDAGNFSDISQETQDLFYELTQNKVIEQRMNLVKKHKILILAKTIIEQFELSAVFR